MGYELGKYFAAVIVVAFVIGVIVALVGYLGISTLLQHISIGWR